MSESSPGEISIPLVWTGAEDQTVEYANAFLSQIDNGGFVLTVGQIAPPIVLPGSPEEMEKQARSIPYIQCKTLHKFSLTPSKMRELVAILNENLDNFEKMNAGNPRRPE